MLTGGLIREHLDPDYPELSSSSPEQRLTDRARIAYRVCTELQHRHNASRRGAHQLRPVPDTVAPLVAPKSTPYCGRSWRRTIPLVLVVTDYEPFTMLRRPKGNVLWIDPSTETTLLDSAAGAGFITLPVPDSTGLLLAGEQPA